MTTADQSARITPEELEHLLALIQPGLTEHFFRDAAHHSAAQLRHSGNQLARALLRIRLALTADQFDQAFIEHTQWCEGELLSDIEADVAKVIRTHFVALAADRA